MVLKFNRVDCQTDLLQFYITSKHDRNIKKKTQVLKLLFKLSNSNFISNYDLYFGFFVTWNG